MREVPKRVPEHPENGMMLLNAEEREIDIIPRCVLSTEGRSRKAKYFVILPIL